MQKKRNLIVANWKMSPTSPAEAKKLFYSTRKSVALLKNTDVVICPPAVFLENLAKLSGPKNLSFGAQNIFSERKGAFTGEISAEMAKNVGAKYVIVGHSERRSTLFGLAETDKVINQKMLLSFDSGLLPILCVGERERDKDASYLSFIKEQLRSGLADVQKKDLVGVIIAYEPLWAIGKSYKESMSPTDIHEMSLFIKKSIGEIYGRDIGQSAQVLYGGSVEKENAEAIVRYGEVRGFLVGHASLSASEFAEILKVGDIK